MKKFVKWVLVYLVAAQLIVNVSAANEDNSGANSERMIEIETSHFFNDISGMFYIYFSDSTCPECVEFEPYLLECIEHNNQVVYHYDLSYWREDAEHDRILSKYHVDSVPLLVKTMNGEYRDAYRFDPDATADETKAQLDEFVLEKSSLFPVTEEKNFPIQFHDYLFTFTFMIMCINLCYLAFKQKDLVTRVNGSPLVWIVVNSTLLFALHIAIAGFGFGFAMQYEANPSTSLFSTIGTHTWLIITPLLYFITLGLALKTKIKQLEAKEDMPE